MDSDSKPCSKCGIDQPPSDYYFNKRDNRIYSHCKICHKSAMARGQRDGRYKVNAEQYLEMFEAQGGVCAICQKPEQVKMNGKPKQLGVDHDHGCCEGQKRCGNCNRGLLCARCNAGLGNLNDDPELLRRALDYLAAYEVRSLQLIAQ